jgi:hypothetical protein
MDLDLRLARHFVVLAEKRHFGRAAASLHLTQPALTKQIQALERQVGAVLIDRTRRPWRLTAAGDEILASSVFVDREAVERPGGDLGDAGQAGIGIGTGIGVGREVGRSFSRAREQGHGERDPIS